MSVLYIQKSTFLITKPLIPYQCLEIFTQLYKDPIVIELKSIYNS